MSFSGNPPNQVTPATSTELADYLISRQKTIIELKVPTSKLTVAFNWQDMWLPCSPGKKGIELWRCHLVTRAEKKEKGKQQQQSEDRRKEVIGTLEIGTAFIGKVGAGGPCVVYITSMQVSWFVFFESRFLNPNRDLCSRFAIRIRDSFFIDTNSLVTVLPCLSQVSGVWIQAAWGPDRPSSDR